MENDKKTREPLDDDALGAVAGGMHEPVPALKVYRAKPGGDTDYAPWSDYYERHPEEDPDKKKP